MREIVSPLDGFLSPFGRRGGAAPDAYAIGGASPELVAAFLTAADGTTEGEYFRTGGVEDDFSMFTFSRSGTATYFDSNGTLQTAADGVARRNAYYYNSGVLTKGGLQLESAAATNLIANSNSFTTISQGTGTQNATGPDGTTSAWTVVDDGLGGSAQVQEYEAVTVATETTYTASIFAKADQISWLNFSVNNFTTPVNSDAFFDLANGVIGTVDAGLDDARMEYYGNGWWRCSITFTTDVADTAGFIRWFLSADGLSNSVTKDGTNSILLYGKQFETGPIATSYIPTSGSTVARAAETLSVASGDWPYSATAMSIYTKVLFTSSTASATSNFYRALADADNYIKVDVSSSLSRIEFFQEASNVRDGVLISSAFTPGTNVPIEIAARHGATFINGAIGGTAGTANETPTALPDLSSDTLSLGVAFNGFIQEIRMWGTDIGDSGIEEVTA